MTAVFHHDRRGKAIGRNLCRTHNLIIDCLAPFPAVHHRGEAMGGNGLVDDMDHGPSQLGRGDG
ncbi:MAG: hypothetical protein GY796_09230 [Chloroflexi bacterium]|nr:hypothetical protein [Chloroflexota bacterium]